jgi:hypothetical protein
MPTSREGKGTKRIQRYPVPIPAELVARLRDAAGDRAPSAPLWLKSSAAAWKKIRPVLGAIFGAQRLVQLVRSARGIGRLRRDPGPDIYVSDEKAPCVQTGLSAAGSSTWIELRVG